MRHLLILLFLFNTSLAFGQTIWYVKANAAGLNNGTSWQNAYTNLQPALDAASRSPDFDRQIWVAAGTYKPSSIPGNGSEDRDKTFRILPNIKIYGGFAGIEPGNYNVLQRNVRANETILSGDLGVIGNNVDNSYHVVISTGGLGVARLDGFTVTGGYANGKDSIIVNGDQFDRFRGGGIYNNNSSDKPVIVNCSITGNSGKASGGVFNDNASPYILNCVVTNNIAIDRGFNKGGAGGISNKNFGTPYIINCLIAGNKGDDGGGILNSFGAGAFIINCTITGNTSLGTTSENNDNAFGGGISILDYSTTYIYNSIVWGNTALKDNNLSNYDSTGTFSVINSIIEGGYPGGVRSLSADPGFINAVSASLAPTAAGDYQLKCTSPAINSGIVGAYTDDKPPPLDLNFNTRLIGSSIDMGAYEYQTEISKNISIQAIAPGSPFRYCPGDSFDVSFNTNDCPGNFTADNIFTLQLSDSNGNFSSPVVIGNLTSASPGTITGKIPTTIPAGDNYHVRITSSSQSFTSQDFNSAITVLSNQTPSITISANANEICAGEKVFFTASVTNAGANPVYQWKKNGNDAGINSSAYSNNSLTSTDVIACEVTNTESCSASNTALSNGIRITIVKVVPTISIIADNKNICSNDTANFKAIITGGGNNPLFQWKRNGINVGGNNDEYSSSELTSTDVITCELISSATCANPLTVLSNQLQVNVTPVVVPVITIATSKDEICPGDLAIFTATIANGGSDPVFHWKKNGINAGTNNISYTDATLTSTDVITCELQSNAICASLQTALSNALTIQVGYVTSTIIIQADKNEICKGEAVNFSAIITNGGNSPVYQWQKNRINVGTNSPSWSDATLINSDIISCTVTSSNGCVSQAIVQSNQLSITINPLPAITLSKSNDINCTKGEAKLMAIGGIKYEWQPAEGIDALSIYNPVVHPSKSTVYNIKVTTDKFCSDTKTITVNVLTTGNYEIPNSFTPNNDGKNDCFGISYLPNISNLNFSIYNRWGQKVFYTRNAKQCWDGKYNGHEQEQGVYIYVIKVTAGCGLSEKNGSVLLIR